MILLQTLFEFFAAVVYIFTDGEDSKLGIDYIENSKGKIPKFFLNDRMQYLGMFYLLLALPTLNNSLESIVVVVEDVLKFHLNQSFDLDMIKDSFFLFNLTKYFIDCLLIQFPYLTEISLQW